MKIMKKSLSGETTTVIFAAAISFATLYSANAENCGGYLGPLPGPDVVVIENEPFVRVSLHRVGEANVVQSMDYFTVATDQRGFQHSRPKLACITWREAEPSLSPSARTSPAWMSHLSIMD